jgi:hypothetical protein
MGSEAECLIIVRFQGPTGTGRPNSHFLRPSPTRSRYVSGDGQSALVVMLD